jgi:glycosyltransferase involved in cell wall biosynthesis
MRIGIVGNLPKPIGGVATTCFQQTCHLIAAGNEVSFYDCDRHPLKNRPVGLSRYTVTKTRKFLFALRLILDIPRRWFTKRHFRVYFEHFIQDILRYQLIFRQPATTLRMLLRSLEMVGTFEGFNIDILIGHHALYDAWVAQLLAKYYFQCPFVVTVYTSEFTLPIQPPGRQIAIEVCNRADTVICISKYAQECMLKAGASPQKVLVNYLGVDPSHFIDPPEAKISAIRRKLGIDEDIPLILYTGWLIKRKGPQVLLEALSKIAYLPWKAYFVGPDHGFMNYLCTRTSELKLTERVIVSDAIPDDEHTLLYNLAYVFIFPTLSQDEGFGLVALEAMAHGIPVIGSKTGAIPEVVIDGKTGFLFTPGDIDDLAKRLQIILNNPELRADMGKAAKKHASQFTWGKNVDQLIHTFQDVNSNYAKPI